MAVLHTEYADSAIREQRDIDNDIRNHISQCKESNYDKVLMEDDRWEIFYHLSQMRRSLLNWYEFTPNSTLLEVGAGTGAMTGLFCDKCSHVTVVERSLSRASIVCERYADRNNLDVYASDINGIRLTDKYDYIVAVGILNTIGNGSVQQTIYVEFLHGLQQFLKPNGKILLAVENRYGLRYFCGALDPYTQKPFSGINKYQETTKGRGFSRQELKNILERSGLNKHKFYYPLPDYQLPQLVYTDEYLPGTNISERLLPYYLNKDTLVANEKVIYADLSENEVFPFFSNSFLVECTNEGKFCDVIYAAVTTDRGEEHGFATTIHNNRIVKKSALYAAGQKKLELFYAHIMDIHNHGVTTVPHSMENNAIVMPYINCMPFSDGLNKVVREGKDKIFQVFDQLYKSIADSSEHISAEKNVLRTEGDKGLPWGVILEKAYIDMVPFNCFYLDNKLMFFDQEFVRNNYPAKYTLFRAIFYTYLSVSEMERILPLQECKEKYELEKLWDIFKEVEAKFVAGNRNYDLYKYFYQWTNVDELVINKRADTLLKYGSQIESNLDEIIEEVEEKYTPSENLLKLQQIETDMLCVFKTICEKYELKYYLFYGTLLGAVRHKGFIPWDDDVDIVMPRADYEKLVTLASEEFVYPYFLETLDNETESFYGGYAKLRNCDTTGIELNNWNHKCNHGIWMDIFPLDIFDENNSRRKKQLQKIRIYQRLLFAKIYREKKEQFRDVSQRQWKIYRALSSVMNREWLKKQLKKSLTEANARKSEYVAVLSRYTTPNGYEFFNKQIFDNSKVSQFENMELTIPGDYKSCLELTTGKGYMKYPPVNMRIPHHQAFFVTDTPFDKYCNRFFEIFNEAKGKEIIIFGAGIMFDDYMNKYGKKYKPKFIVDNSSNKWGTIRNGCMVKQPEDILKVEVEKRCVIICNIYYKEIERQLQEMGIIEYYIYVQEKAWLLQEPPK